MTLPALQELSPSRHSLEKAKIIQRAASTDGQSPACLLTIAKKHIAF
jgi:hypothetical protein